MAESYPHAVLPQMQAAGQVYSHCLEDRMVLQKAEEKAYFPAFRIKYPGPKKTERIPCPQTRFRGKHHEKEQDNKMILRYRKRQDGGEIHEQVDMTESQTKLPCELVHRAKHQVNVLDPVAFPCFLGRPHLDLQGKTGLFIGSRQT